MFGLDALHAHGVAIDEYCARERQNFRVTSWLCAATSTPRPPRARRCGSTSVQGKKKGMVPGSWIATSINSTRSAKSSSRTRRRLQPRRPNNEVEEEPDLRPDPPRHCSAPRLVHAELGTKDVRYLPEGGHLLEGGLQLWGRADCRRPWRSRRRWPGRAPPRPGPARPHRVRAVNLYLLESTSMGKTSAGSLSASVNRFTPTTIFSPSSTALAKL